jgi:hypothetical protein
VLHAPALTHMLCRTKHVLAGPGVSRFNSCLDLRTPREAIILIHALTLIDHHTFATYVNRGKQQGKWSVGPHSLA